MLTQLLDCSHTQLYKTLSTLNTVTAVLQCVMSDRLNFFVSQIIVSVFNLISVSSSIGGNYITLVYVDMMAPVNVFPSPRSPFLFDVSIEHKVIVVGLDNAGKTTVLYQ